ncbi:hypothetical protein K438DRAFT_1997668 [Mycena galopus ATCC 62051]|nr:hypothetical protein K438DRAFT_1997668 [Mycena galopus ATCC 62051]
MIRLRLIDSQIENAVGQLREERASFSAFADAHRALISLVRRLPLDILQEIFVACACLPTHRNCACVMSASEPPLWFSLHIAEPQIPAEMSLHSIHEQKYAQQVEIIKAWLARSRCRYPSSAFLSLSSTPEFSGTDVRVIPNGEVNTNTKFGSDVGGFVFGRAGYVVESGVLD